MVKEGYYFGLPPLLLGLIGLGTGTRTGVSIAVPLILLGLFVFYFFRDPDRHVSKEPGLVVSPADGKVVVVTDEDHAGSPGKRVSIFLAIWNVHVNRSPAAGQIKTL